MCIKFHFPVIFLTCLNWIKELLAAIFPWVPLVGCPSVSLRGSSNAFEWSALYTNLSCWIIENPSNPKVCGRLPEEGKWVSLEGFCLTSKEGWTPFYQTVGAPDFLGLGRDPTASSILTPHNSCDLTPPMRGTQQNRSLVWQEGPYDNHTAPRTNPHPQRGLELILG